MNKKPTGIEIGLLVYPGAQLSAIHGLTDLFVTANKINTDQRTDQRTDHAVQLIVSHWQNQPGTSSVERCYATDERAHPQLSALIVPPCFENHQTNEPGPHARDWVQIQHKGGAVVCSTCAAAFVLAEIGLLEGRAATTHWALKEQFAASFPNVKLHTEKLIVDDGDIITAGGVMAWVDLGLKLVNRFLGPSVMLETARFFLADPSGRKQQFYSTFQPRLDHGDERVLKAQHWMQANYDQQVTIAAAATHAGLGERTYLRRFQKATGMNPTPYLQRLRVGKARELLELSSMPFNQIAWKVGYDDTGAFRRVFEKVMGLGPGEYRRRFAVG